MSMRSLKETLRPLASVYWGFNLADRLALWWNGLFARSFQARPVFRDSEPFENIPRELSELLFAIPSSQGNFERAGVTESRLKAALSVSIEAGLVVSVLKRRSKANHPWALRADDNDSLSGPQLLPTTGTRFNKADFEGHTEVTERLTKKVMRSRLFYVHKPGDEKFLSRAELRQADAIEIDVWRKMPGNSTIHSSNYWNATCRDIEIDEPANVLANFARRIPRTFDDFTRSGSEFVQFPIDLVYLWVDGTDEKWLETKEKFTAGGESVNHASKANHRFREFDELRHSIRSVEAFAPWIRYIYIVTAKQTPKWLTEISTKIRIVDHSEIIPTKWLPTYSSHVIAAHLHHIEGLAEHFIYFNDDVFFASQTVPERWYHPNGIALGHVARNRLPAVTAASSTVVKLARRATVSAVRSHGVEASTKNLGHGPMPWRRSILDDVWREFSRELNATGARRFRHADDMIPDWLVAIFGESTGKLMRLSYLRGRYVAMNKRKSIMWITLLLRRSHEYDYFCLNDGEARNTRTLVSERYQPHRYHVIFRHLFPHRSRFEKSGTS